MRCPFPLRAARLGALLLTLGSWSETRAQGSLAVQLTPPQRITVGLPDPALARGMLTLLPGGELDGFARRLLERAAVEAGLELEFRRIPQGTGIEPLLAGELDAICPLSITNERIAELAFTAPILLVEGAVFVRAGEPAPRNVAELARRRVVVAQYGVAHQFCEEKNIPFEPRATLLLALRSLLDGTADCVVSTQVAGRFDIERHRLQGLSDALLDEDRLRQAFAVAVRDQALAARLDYGLAAVHDSGAWAELYDQWVAPYQPRPRARSHAPLIIGTLLALVCVAGAALFLLRMRLSRSARALDESEQSYRLVAESLPALVYSTFVGTDGRREQRFATSNLAEWRRRFPELDPGGDEQALIASIHPEDRQAYAENVARARTQGTRLVAEFRLRSSGGDYRWLHATVTPIPIAGGTLRQSLLLDTTPLHEVREERHRLELQLAQVQRLESLGLMASGMAHEFNNLLMEIQGSVELALGASDPDARHEHLESALRGTRRASERTRELLARTGAAGPEPELPGPDALARASAGVRRDEGSLASVAQGVPGRFGRVLVIDDDARVRRVAMAILETRGWAVDGVGDAPAALRHLRAQPAAIVLLDLTMPVIDGRALLRQLRAEFPALPVVLMSGYSEQEGAGEGPPSDGFVHKPFTGDELVAALTRALAGRSSESPDALVQET